MKKVTYKNAGVDVKRAEDFARKINVASRSKIGAFGAIFDAKPILKKYRNPILVSSTDGVGTKLKIAQQSGIHSTVGVDLVAMNVNDIVCLGARPLFFLDYIACGKLEVNVLTEIMNGS